MAKEVCIWNRKENIARFTNRPEVSATYDQMISEGWKPINEGEITVLFSK